MGPLNERQLTLSVIVPVYNAERYLEQCLKSICTQTYTNLEIILVDDGSTDKSGVLCDNCAKNDERIVVIHQENSGQINARKAGALVATGDYIVCVDADDWIETDRFNNLIKYGLSDLPDMVHMDGEIWEYVDHIEHKMYSNFDRNYEGEDIVNSFLRLVVGEGPFMDRKITICHWKSAIKRSIYLDNLLCFNTNIRKIEDVIFIFSCVLDCKKIVCINEDGYHYRQNTDSVTHRAIKWQSNHARMYYEQFMGILYRHSDIHADSITEFVTQYTYHNLIMTNYRRLYEYYAPDLFPYIDVAPRSRIIVYGAGYVGTEIVNVIADDNRYELVAWVDKSPISTLKSEIEIRDLSVINEVQYDYILIAILLSSVSSRVVTQLIDIGVDSRKIKTMQKSFMQYDELDSLTNV